MVAERAAVVSGRVAVSARPRHPLGHVTQLLFLFFVLKMKFAGGFRKI